MKPSLCGKSITGPHRSDFTTESVERYRIYETKKVGSMQKYKLSTERPDDFDHAIVCAGGYLTFEGKLLLLKRHPKKTFGNTWGVPGGKLEQGETPEEGLLREVFEEVGFEIDRHLIEHFCTLYIESEPRLDDVIYHMYYYPLDELPVLSLQLEEHLEAQWISPDEALKIPLVDAGGIEALHVYKEYLKQKQNYSNFKR